MYPHVRAKKPDLERHLIQYPVEDRLAQWENKKKWFQSQVTKVVGTSQPYRSRADFAGHPFRVLRELVDRDKHRDLVISNYLVHAFEVGKRDLYEVVSTTVHRNTPMALGAVVAEANLLLAQAVNGQCWETVPTEIGYRVHRGA